jgi:hypothetical protein
MKDRIIQITLTDQAGFTQTFTSLKALYKFSLKEAEFWSDSKSSIKSIYRVNNGILNCHSHFDGIVNSIKSWEPHLETWDDNELKESLRQLKTNHLQHLKSRWIYSNSSYVGTLIQCFIDYNQDTAMAFLNYIIHNTPPINGDVNSFNGAMLGYEFKHQNSDLNKRRVSERRSLNQIRSNYENSQDILFSEVSTKQSNIDNWYESAKKSHLKRNLAAKRLARWQLNKNNTNIQNKFTSWDLRRQELEKTYEEKLKLSKPAEYWKKAAEKYSVQGRLWGVCLAFSLCVGVYYFGNFFVTWLNNESIKLTVVSVQGVVFFGFFATVYAYSIKLLSKLTLSSFHLMRDAEEREQLTYLYLSLNKESALDTASRDIVLQSFFSRSETGLLTKEQGPTMPGVGELLKALKGR